MDAITADALNQERINPTKPHEPRVNLTKVEVLPVFEQNKINVSVEYRIIGLPVVENITFVLQRPE